MESRIEDIVSATIGGKSYNKPGESRIENLLIDLKEQFDDKVDKESGKGLSTNDFTTAEKTKLDGLAEIKSIGTGLALDDSTGELVATGGSGGGGTLDYTELINKPQINGVILSDNKSLSDLGITYESETAASDGTTLSLVTTGEKYTWNNKQSAIDDLSTIRSGAALGATAVQPVTGKGLSTNDYTDTEKSKLADIAAGAEVNEIEGIKVNNTTVNPDSNKVVNITVPTTAADVSALPDTTKYAAALSLTINSSTYVMTGQLKDQNGDNLGTAQTIDLPLESVVVGGSYNSQTKKVVLTLQNGNTVEFSVADLVSGLQTELSASNKLNPAYIDYDSTHAAVTKAQREQIETNKNNILSVQTQANWNTNNGVKNLSPFNNGTGNSPLVIPFNFKNGESYTVSWSSITSTSTSDSSRIDFMSGDNSVVSNIYYAPHGVAGSTTLTLTADCDSLWVYAGRMHEQSKTVTVNNLMVRPTSIADSTYEPYAMSNVQLTEKVERYTAYHTTAFSTANAWTYTDLSFTIPANQIYYFLASVSWSSGQPLEICLSTSATAGGVATSNIIAQSNVQGNIVTCTGQMTADNNNAVTIYCYAKNNSATGSSPTRLTAFRIA